MVIAFLLIGGIETLYLDPLLSPFDPALFFTIILLIAIVGGLIFRRYALLNSAKGLYSCWVHISFSKSM